MTQRGADGADTQDAPNWWILFTVGVGTFMSALDGSVTNTVLPVLTRELHSSVATVEWVVTVYLLVTGGLVLSAGRWGDLRGQKPTYQAGFVLFVAGSALCGLAPSVDWLIAFRALQGVGSALLSATSPAIVTLNFPARLRGQALGLQAMLTYSGISAGPLLGGWLATEFGWRSVFYINVPVGLLALWLASRFVPARPPAARAQKFDVGGAVLFFLTLSALMVALDRGHAWGWGSAPTIGLAALALLGLAAFVFWERRAPEPMLNLRLFGNRTFTAASVSAALNFVTLSGLLFLLPFYLIGERHLSAARAGLIIVALPVAMAVAAPVSGAVADRIGTRIPAILGMIVLALGVFLLTEIGPHTPFPLIAWKLALAGLGVGIFLSPNNSALMGAAARDQQGVAAGVRATARNLGNILGVGAAGAVFSSVLARGAPGASLFPAFHAAMLLLFAASVIGVLASAARA